MTGPKVSVIVPCYNGGGFLDALMASLAAQTFRDFEIIIVDDGSTDEPTRQVLRRLEPQARIVRQENRGLPAARNTGFREARGEYVVPLDCDDLLAPSFLAETVGVLGKAPDETAFVFCHMLLMGEIEGVLPRHFNRFDQLILNQLPYCMLIRRSAWAAVGGYDETMREGYEDWEFNIRLVEAGFVGVEIPEPLFVYRVSAQGMLLSGSARKHGALWHAIRARHREYYRLGRLLAVERDWRAPPRRFGLAPSLMLLSLARVLPDALVGWIFYVLLRSVHRLRVRRGTFGRMRTGRLASASADDARRAAPAPGRAAESYYGATRAKRDLRPLRFTVSICLVALAIHYIGARDLLSTLMQVDFTMLVYAFALFVLQVLVVAWRFRLVLSVGGIGVSYPRALEATAVSLIANVILFTNVAGIVYRIVVLRAPSHSVSALVVASIIERVAVFAVLLLAALLGVAWLHISVDLASSGLVLAAVAAVTAAAAGAVWLAFRLWPQLGDRALRRFPDILRLLKPYARDRIAVAKIVWITFVSHLVFVAAATVAAAGTNVLVDVYDLAAAVSATMLIASLPISVSGWGVREMSLVWLLGLLGVAAPAALAFSVVLGVVSLLAAMSVAAACIVLQVAR